MDYKNFYISRNKVYNKIKKNKSDLYYKCELTNDINFYNEISFLPNICKEDENYFYIEPFKKYRNIKFTDLISKNNKLQYLLFKNINKITLSDIGEKIFHDIKNIKQNNIVKTHFDNFTDEIKEMENAVKKIVPDHPPVLIEDITIQSDYEFENIFVNIKNNKLIDWKFYNKNENLFYFCPKNIIINDSSIIDGKPVGEEIMTNFANKNLYIVNNNKIYEI